MSNTLAIALLDSHKLSEKIERLLLENDGLLNDEIEDLIAFKGDTLAVLAQKVDSQAVLVDRLQSAIEFYNEQLKALQGLMKTIIEVRSKALTNVSQTMESLGIDTLSGHHKEFKFRKSPPSVEILDESLIPQQFKEITMVEKISKKELATALKLGVEIQGARLTSGRSLTVKVAKPRLKEGGSNE
jgi:hypothetical protein